MQQMQHGKVNRLAFLIGDTQLVAWPTSVPVDVHASFYPSKDEDDCPVAWEGDVPAEIDCGGWMWVTFEPGCGNTDTPSLPAGDWWLKIEDQAQSGELAGMQYIKVVSS